MTRLQIYVVYGFHIKSDTKIAIAAGVVRSYQIGAAL
jgi:hypothetical protein